MSNYETLKSLIATRATQVQPLGFDRWRSSGTVPDLRAVVLTEHSAPFEVLRQMTAAKDEVRWLDSTSPLETSEIAEWICEPRIGVGFYLRERAAGRLVAFGAIEIVQPNVKIGEGPSWPQERLLVSRLVVDPTMRRQGIGGAACQYLASLARAVSEHTVPPLVRLAPDDTNGLRLLERLPFTEIDLGSSGAPFRWFEFGEYSKARNFASEVVKLRNIKRITQSELAFHCGLRRSAVAAIEAQIRLPSLNVLRLVGAALADQIDERNRLYLSALGVDGDPAEGPSWTQLDSAANIWYVTDDIEWALEAHWLGYLATAISRGANRWFFMPKAIWATKGEALLRRLARQVDDDRLRRGLRIFEAPSTLCSLRLVLTSSLHRNVELHVSNERGQLTKLQGATANRLSSSIRQATEELEEEPGGQVDGFRLLFPAHMAQS